MAIVYLVFEIGLRMKVSECDSFKCSIACLLLDSIRLKVRCVQLYSLQIKVYGPIKLYDKIIEHYEWLKVVVFCFVSDNFK